MIRSSIIVVNLLIALLVKLVAGAPSAEIKAPASVNAGESFLVEVTINPNGVTDFMRYSMEFPAGWKAEKVETAGASFLFEKNSTNDKYSAKFLWSRVGDVSELKISFRVTAPDDFSGNILFSNKLSHTVDNLPSNVLLPPLELTVNGTANTKPVANVPDSTAKPPVTISVVRTVPQGEQSGQFLVDIVINKEDLANFGKLEDSLPDGFSAKKVMTDGSDFTFDKGKVKFSWWVMPKKPSLHVQYMVIVSPDVSGTKTINGIFSYVENESGKIYTVAPSSVTMKANPATVVENNNPGNQQEENNSGNSQEANTATAGNNAKENNQGNSQEENTATAGNNSKENNSGNAQEENSAVAGNNQKENNSGNAQQENTSTAGTNQKENNSGNTQQENTATAGSNSKENNGGNSQQEQAASSGIAKAGSFAGVSFSVQIAAMIRRVPVAYYTSTFGIPGIVNAEQIEGLNKYTNGTFTTYQEARNHRESLRMKGVVAPFVVAYNEGKRITVQEALMITSQKWIP